jgi:hypothetical protein
VSRTATATLVFTDERHRETWLETHGLVPPKHGEYTGVAERVDYEHRRDQATLVFTIEPEAPRPVHEHGVSPKAHEPIISREMLRAAAIPPDDHELPFPGRFHKRRLSTLDDAEMLALHHALTALSDLEGACADCMAWLTRIDAWSYYRRGVSP